MLHYAGEWYWGVDRLHYLLDRLSELRAAKKRCAGSPAGIYQAGNESFPAGQAASGGQRLAANRVFSFVPQPVFVYRATANIRNRRCIRY